MESTLLKIGGMTCGGCVRSVTNALQSAPGVSKAEVDLATGQARIEFNPAQTNLQQLASLIDDIGFEVL